MKVLKFGGTSVGTVASLGNVKSIVEACDEPVIVVVSALGGLTDCLIDTARRAAAGDSEGYRSSVAAIIDRHHSVVAGIVDLPRQSSLLNVIDPLLSELAAVYDAVSRDAALSDEMLDLIVSFGERISSHIVTAIIDGAQRFDSLTFIKTQKSFGRHILDNAASQPLIHARFDTFAGRVAVVPGFIATDSATGVITNLGRGGSDYTAAILAAALNARVLEIWTDVDGFMTADPRTIASASVIDRMTFVEAMDLCNFGAKVIYPPTIYPVFHKNIPILIKNTFNPSAPGTLVSDIPGGKRASEVAAVKGISSVNDTCLITVKGMGMVGVGGISSRIFNAMARSGISVFMVSKGSSENSISFAVRASGAERAVSELRTEFADELAKGDISDISARDGLATVAVVGSGMNGDPDCSDRVFGLLSRRGVPVMAFACGESQSNMLFVVESERLREVMQFVHDTFFPVATTVVDVLVAGGDCGSGKVLLDMLSAPDVVASMTDAPLTIRAADGSPDAIDSDGGDVCRIFVDCSTSDDYIGRYAALLNDGVNVVCLSEAVLPTLPSMLSELQRACSGVEFRYEGLAGAGLPVIELLRRLRESLSGRELHVSAALPSNSVARAHLITAATGHQVIITPSVADNAAEFVISGEFTAGYPIALRGSTDTARMLAMSALNDIFSIALSAKS